MKHFFLPTKAKTGILTGFLLFSLTACEEGTGPAPVAQVPSDGTTIEQDVERPDIFSVSEKALWDGRPSLGGVWVAYPGDIEPERVLITNVENGQTVIGAMFRRERENPGPRIQMSSDAASALGVLAGAPTEISIVVLKRETIEILPEPVVEDTETEELGELVEETLADLPVGAGTPVDAVTPPVPRAPEATLAIVAEPAPAGPIPAKPYIQIGTFSSEQNAKDLVTILGNEGVIAEIRTDDTGERTLYRVVSGPASTAAERDERLRIIKSLGFTDAFIFG